MHLKYMTKTSMKSSIKELRHCHHTLLKGDDADDFKNLLHSNIQLFFTTVPCFSLIVLSFRHAA